MSQNSKDCTFPVTAWDIVAQPPSFLFLERKHVQRARGEGWTDKYQRGRYIK